MSVSCSPSTHWLSKYCNICISYEPTQKIQFALFGVMRVYSCVMSGNSFQQLCLLTFKEKSLKGRQLASLQQLKKKYKRIGSTNV